MRKMKNFMLVLLALCSLTLISCNIKKSEVKYSISINETSVELNVNEEKTLVATLLADGEPCSDSITWTTSDSTIASVENGKVKGLTAGNATITASAHDVTATASVKVNEVEVFLVLNYSSSTLKVGETLQLSATLTDGSTPSLTYTSSNAAVANVSEAGLITAVSEGETTITVFAGEDVAATCKIIVSNVYELIFPTIENTTVYVGDSIDLNPILKVNGENSTQAVEILGEGFTVSGDIITITKTGAIVVTVKFGELEFSQTLDSWIKITTVEEFLNIKNDLNGQYKLVNDLDFNGATVAAFSSYKTFNSASSKGFAGIFDGQGHKISNITPSYNKEDSTDRDISIFGYLTSTAIVKNVAFYNVTATDRFSLVSSYCFGTIENVYADIKYISTTAGNVTATNPAGTLVAKVQASAKISNCVVNLSFAEDAYKTNVGAFASNLTSGAQLSNCYVLCDEELAFTINGAQHAGNKAQAFTSLTSLNASINKEEFDSSIWQMNENCIPHIGTVKSDVTVDKTEYQVYQNSTIQLEAAKGLHFILKSAVSNVELTADGKLTIDQVAEGTQIKVLVTDYYDAEPVEVNIIVLKAEIIVDDSQFTTINFDLFLGVSSQSEYTKSHNLIIKKGNEVYTGNEITFASSDENVVTVDATNVTAVNNGKAKVSVLCNGVEIYSFEVSVSMCYGISTKEQFLAIGTNATTLSYNYKLLNDIDFEGQQIKAFSAWSTKDTRTFTGTFDGQGYTLSNFELVKNADTSSDISLFGYMSAGSVVRNVNFINVVTTERSAVVASWVEGGTIENVFVDVYYASTTVVNISATNPGAGIASKIYSGGLIQDCVVNLRYADTFVLELYYGGIVGYVGSNTASVKDCVFICDNEYIIPVYNYGQNVEESTVVNVNSYLSIEELNEADLSYLDSSLWTKETDIIPHLGTINIDNSIVVEEEIEIYQGFSTSLNAQSKLPLYYSIDGNVAGVEIDLNGNLSVALEVSDNTTFNVVVRNYYGGSKVVKVTVVELPYEITSIESFETEYIVGYDSNIAHNVVVKSEGETLTEGVSYTSSNEAVATVDQTHVTLVGGEGETRISVLVDNVVVHYFTITVTAVYYPIKTAEDFKAIGTSLETMSLKYKLMNDIDFEGAEVNGLSAYGTVATLVFKGVFDGQGYSLMNMKLAKSNWTGAGVDESLFGSLWYASTVIKNLSVIGAEIDGCGGVIASRVHSGTIENCYVDVKVTGTNNVKANYDIGAIAYCVQAAGVIKDCISTVSVAEGLDTTYVAGVVGWNQGTIENCKSIVLTGQELKVVTTGAGIVTNTEVYTSVEAFYENVDTTGYSDVWTFDEHKQNVPHFRSINNEITITTEDKTVYQGAKLQLEAYSKLPVYYELEEELEGVSITFDGLLQVDTSVAANTIIKVIAKTYYGQSTTVEVTVKGLPIEVTSVGNVTVEECILGEENSIIAHNIVTTLNGQPYTEDITYVSTNETVATVDDTNVTVLGEGTTTIKVLYEGEEIHSFTVTVTVVYHPIKTAEDFLAIGTSLATMSLKYKLMNSIDFEGATINAFSAYNTINTMVFKGMFDGQGYSLMNFKLAKSNLSGASVDVSLFGTVWGATTVIKNLSVIGAEIDGCGGVIASRLHSGTIENCYVDVKVTGTNNVKAYYDIGAIAYYLQAGGKIKDCISTVSVAEGLDTTYVAGVVGWNAGPIENCKSIVLTGQELKVVTTGAGTVTNTEVYTSVEAFYENVDTTGYSDVWTFDENKQILPHLGTVNNEITITTEDKTVYQGGELQLEVDSKLPVYYELEEELEGVSITFDGLLQVDTSVIANTIIKVITKTYYGQSTTVEVTVKGLPIEVTSVGNVTVEECILGEENSIIAHNIITKLNGQPYTEDITYVSTNEAVATVDDTNVTILGEGTTTIQVLYKGEEVHSFTVTVNAVYHPIKTAEDFKAIGTSLETMSLKYKLMNNIDFEGATVNSLSAYDTVATLVFKGVFDGQGYSLMNMKLGKSNWTGAKEDVSLFGALWYATTVIKNLSVIGAEIDGYGAVIASRVHSGTIENCYVDVKVTGTNNVVATKDIGAIACVVQAAGVIKNCISTITVAEGLDTTYVAGIVGYHVGTIENCKSIVLTGEELQIYTTKYGTPTVTNTEVYTSVEAFYENVDLTGYSDIWTFDENKQILPHLGTVNNEITITTEDKTVYQGGELQLEVDSKLPVYYELEEELEGVSITFDGLLQVNKSVAANTAIKVIAKTYYGQSTTVEVTVKGLSVEVTSIDSLEIEYIVGSEVSFPHNIQTTLNGEAYSDGITYVSSNEAVATVDDTNVTLLGGEGTATISVLHNGNEIHSFTVEVVVYNPVRTTEDFLAIGTSLANMSLKYKLMNDIDFEGATINAFSAYATINTMVFKGVFDGQGYSLMNMKLAKSNVAGAGVDVSLFGTVWGANTVIKNLSVIGAEIDGCGGVIASRLHSGTIENCYVDVTVTGLNNVKAYYDIGAVVYNLQGTGTLKNCISTITVSEGLDTTYVAGVVGWNQGTIQNCQTIVLTGQELKPTTTNAGTYTNSNVYTSIEAFYENVDTTGYSDVWTFDEKKENLPHLGELTNLIEFETEEVYSGISNEIKVSSKLPVTYSLVEAIEGVTLTSDGSLSVASTVELGTIIKINVADNYGNSKILEVTVVELPLEVTSVESVDVTECITGEADSIIPHYINVTLGGEAYTEGITYVSTNEAVATVDSTNVTITGEGTTTVKVLFNGVEIHSFTVTATTVYHGVRTVEDFKAIGTSLATMSLKYKLMNNIDFEGAVVNSLSAYDTVATLVFKGIFDGQGYSLMNMKLGKSNWTGAKDDVSLFGALWYAPTVIKNLSVIGAEIDGYGAVIASRVHSGTIENCYVEVTVTGTNYVKSTQDIGAIACVVQAAGVIKDCISVVTIAEGIDTTYVGAIVGYHVGTIENCKAIVLTGEELQVYTTKYGTPTVTNTEVYTSVEAFYESVDTTGYSDVWTFDENKEELPGLNPNK